MVTKLKTSNCDKPELLKVWQNPNTQIETKQKFLQKLKISNCDKTQILKCDKNQKLKEKKL